MEAIQTLASPVPFRTEPFAPWPQFGEDEVAAVQRVLTSGKVNYWTGEEGRRFEEAFAKVAGCRYGVALMNGTVALELALRAVGVGPGDEVVVTPRSFVASASAAVWVGATPVFADVDPVSQNITAETVEAVLTPRTKAVIAVHLAGWPCEMGALMALAEARGLYVIEDCAQAHGAAYHDRPVGALGHLAAFSFCQDKILTTGGEGGMVVTNDEALWKRLWSLKDHGKNYDTVFDREHPPGFRWLHESFGTNGRMTEMQAALGNVMLPKLPDWVARRRHHAARLAERFSALPALRVTEPPPHVRHSYYKYYIFVRPERLRPGWDRDRIMVEVGRQGVPCYSGSCSEIYQEHAFTQAGLEPPDRLPHARRLGETSLMFLVHPTLDTDAMKDTVRAVERVLRRATM